MNNQETKVARLAFFQDMIDYYSTDPAARRALNNRDTMKFGVYRCLYRTPDGRRCGIGRHIPDEKYFPGLEGQPADKDSVLNVLPVPVRQLGGSFLSLMQSFHDNDEVWDNEKKRLTTFGEEMKDDIEQAIENGANDYSIFMQRL